MEAIVLAGGLGTRLSAVVRDVPKPMAPVHGRPFLTFVLDGLVDAGFTAAVLATGYLHEALHAYFGVSYRGLALTYSVESQPLGTGGAIRLAWNRITAREAFVLNGDTFADVDFRAMQAAHVRAGGSLTMAICHVPDVARYGALELRDDTVVGFAEKVISGPGWINAGIYVMDRVVPTRLAAGRASSFEHDLLAREVATLRPLAFRCSGRFVDIGTPEDYARAEGLLANG